MATQWLTLRRIYQAVNDEAAAIALDDFEAEWGQKYPSIAPSWRRAWQEGSARLFT